MYACNISLPLTCRNVCLVFYYILFETIITSFTSETDDDSEIFQNNEVRDKIGPLQNVLFLLACCSRLPCLSLSFSSVDWTDLNMMKITPSPAFFFEFLIKKNLVKKLPTTARHHIESNLGKKH